MWIRVNWDRKCRDMGQELIIASWVDIFKNLYLIGEVISEGREKEKIWQLLLKEDVLHIFLGFFFFHFQDGASTPNTVWLCKEKEINIFFSSPNEIKKERYKQMQNYM